MTNYDAYAKTFSNSRKNLHWSEVGAIINDMRQCDYTNILDVGCGNGRLLTEMQNSKFKIQNYLGIDSSEWMIEEARKCHPESHFETCSMLTHWILNLESWIFNAIIFVASFHHLETREERIQVLSEIKKYLAPAGAVYMTNWNLRDQTKYEKSHRWDGDYDIKIGEFSRYYHGFTTEELAKLFHETGYQVIENKVFEWGRNIWSKIQVV